MMKAKVCITAVCLLAVFSAGAFANMIVNGSFEDPSPTGWDGGFKSYSHISQVYYTGPAPAGAGEIYGWAWGETTWGSASQTVDLTGLAGQIYTFSSWLAAYYANDDYAYITLDFKDAGGSSLGTVEFDGNDGTSPYIVGSANSEGLADPTVAWALDNWTLYQASGVVPAGAASAVVTIESRATNDNGNDAYVDLVSLTVVPEPMTISLLALGGLALLRKRK